MSNEDREALEVYAQFTYRSVMRALEPRMGGKNLPDTLAEQLPNIISRTFRMYWKDRQSHHAA